MKLIDIWDNLMFTVLNVRNLILLSMKICLGLYAIIVVFAIIKLFLPYYTCSHPLSCRPIAKMSEAIRKGNPKSNFCHRYGKKEDDSYLLCELHPEYTSYAHTAFDHTLKFVLFIDPMPKSWRNRKYSRPPSPRI